MRIDADLLQEHLSYLVRRCGVRLAGSCMERRAADYIGNRMLSYGGLTTTEQFPMLERRVQALDLAIRIQNRWVKFPGSLLSSTPGTGGRVVQAPIVVFEAPAEYRSKSLAHLRGKAVIHLGTHIESRADYRRLIAAKPAFILIVDIRFPGVTPLADGMFPAYTHLIGAVPTVNVAFADAWRWHVEGATAARLMVRGGMEPSLSQNVIADFPGRDPGAGMIVLGGHHDTQADSPGADDNGSGVAGILELARVLGPLPRRRGLRFISFGAEEQLSVGAAAYVRRHRTALRRDAVLMFNLDSYGSWMGWSELYCNGPRNLARIAQPYFNRAGAPVKIMLEPSPYGDHFPFVAIGVPGMWLYRPNCAGGRFYHHRPDDDLTRVSPVLMARYLTAVGAFIHDLSNAKRLPYKRVLPPELRRAASRFWNDLY